jgi:hypothetical protein
VISLIFGAVEQQHGVRAFCDTAADLVAVELHGLCVGKPQCEGCAGSARRADGAEQIGALVALSESQINPSGNPKSQLSKPLVLIALYVERSVAIFSRGPAIDGYLSVCAQWPQCPFKSSHRSSVPTSWMPCRRRATRHGCS